MVNESGSQVLRVLASSPLFDYSPFIALLDNASSNVSGVQPGWIGMSNANGAELLTYGEDKDGTWIVVKNVSCGSLPPWHSSD